MKPFRVRIQRNRKSSAQMMINWGNFILDWVVKPYYAPMVQANRDYIQEQKLLEVQSRTRLNDERLKLLQDQVVLKDMQIELMRKKLEDAGIGGSPFAPPSDEHGNL